MLLIFVYGYQKSPNMNFSGPNILLLLATINEWNLLLGPLPFSATEIGVKGIIPRSYW